MHIIISARLRLARYTYTRPLLGVEMQLDQATFHPFQMSTISESSLSLVASTLPPSSSTQTMLLGFLTIAFTGSIMYCASPMRLTNVLVAAMANAEKTYL